MRADAVLETPVGRLAVTEEGGRIIRLRWGGEAATGTPGPVSLRALDQLRAYFAGDLRSFDLPLDLGEGFQARFLAALLDIPFGETRTYGDLAGELGVPAQAIGQACGANRIPVIIPCHRVLGASGLGGYSGRGGVETKVWLLRHEGAGGLLI
jgi:methylated-DNA-[protein]-cysteine S-methyltransferase